jgi:hypothetical protein
MGSDRGEGDKKNGRNLVARARAWFSGTIFGGGGGGELAAGTGLSSTLKDAVRRVSSIRSSLSGGSRDQVNPEVRLWRETFAYGVITTAH